MRLDLNAISKLDLAAANLAYKSLQQSQLPVFSGSVDHRINLFAERELV